MSEILGVCDPHQGQLSLRREKPDAWLAKLGECWHRMIDFPKLGLWNYNVCNWV